MLACHFFLSSCQLISGTYILSNDEPTWKFFFEHDRPSLSSDRMKYSSSGSHDGDDEEQPCHLIEPEIVQFNEHSVSIKFNWRCVWIVRSSRINLPSANVSSIPMTSNIASLFQQLHLHHGERRDRHSRTCWNKDRSNTAKRRDGMN